MSKLQSWEQTSYNIYSLLVDLKYNRLVNGITQLHIQGISTQMSSPSPSLLPKQRKTDFDAILLTYPDIVQPCNTEAPVKHKDTHHINTVGPPVHARPRRLSPEHLKAPRQEFKLMLQQGIIRPSSSSWASPLHMFQRSLGIGVHVGIQNSQPQCQTATQSHISKISLQLHKAPLFFPR